jgi:hypothetical protein
MLEQFVDPRALLRVVAEAVPDHLDERVEVE